MNCLYDPCPYWLFKPARVGGACNWSAHPSFETGCAVFSTKEVVSIDQS